MNDGSTTIGRLRYGWCMVLYLVVEFCTESTVRNTLNEGMHATNNALAIAS